MDRWVGMDRQRDGQRDGQGGIVVGGGGADML